MKFGILRWTLMISSGSVQASALKKHVEKWFKKNTSADMRGLYYIIFYLAPSFKLKDNVFQPKSIIILSTLWTYPNK